jgi:hypothetical protein
MQGGWIRRSRQPSVDYLSRPVTPSSVVAVCSAGIWAAIDARIFFDNTRAAHAIRAAHASSAGAARARSRATRACSRATRAAATRRAARATATRRATGAGCRLEDDVVITACDIERTAHCCDHQRHWTKGRTVSHSTCLYYQPKPVNGQRNLQQRADLPVFRPEKPPKRSHQSLVGDSSAKVAGISVAQPSTSSSFGTDRSRQTPVWGIGGSVGWSFSFRNFSWRLMPSTCFRVLIVRLQQIRIKHCLAIFSFG